jgi:hypothetical protein
MSATPPAREGATSAVLGITDAVASSIATALGGVALAASALAPGEAPGAVVGAFLAAAAVAGASLVPAARLRREPAPHRPQARRARPAPQCTQSASAAMSAIPSTNGAP